MVTPSLRVTVRALLAGCDAADPIEIARQTAEICELLARQVSRLVGELGTRALFERALHLAAVAFPRLREVKGEAPFEALRLMLASETAAIAMEAGVHALDTFVELLARFIGEPLVTSLLREVWPGQLPRVVVKEST